MARRDFAAEMRCQLLHDSLYARDGWCRCYVLRLGAAAVGFAGVVVGGPWSSPAPRCGHTCIRLSLRSTAQPRYTRFSIIFNSCFSEVAIGYNPAQHPPEEGRGELRPEVRGGEQADVQARVGVLPARAGNI